MLVSRMSVVKRFLERHIPRPLYRVLVAPYHFFLALYAAFKYRFPARELTVIAITGTKGKSSVSEMIATIFEKAGHKVALSSTIHFRINGVTTKNLYKMTLPGHGFIQKFLRDAVTQRCDIAVIEVSSEAAVQYRHLFLALNAFVFTNLSKEHLESHGSMENYFQAKLRIGHELCRSRKRPRAVISNAQNLYGKRVLELPVENRIPFALYDAEDIVPSDTGIAFTYKGVRFTLPQPGTFSVMNALAATKTAEFFGVSIETARDALEGLTLIPGRAERIALGQPFVAVVDYAHTPDSLKALYAAFPERKICVLGNTGGGRDTWKRPEMGRIADELCDEVILTDEDPYDEDPEAIVEEMAKGMMRSPTILMDRREAIHEALARAKEGDVVLITGKGTDPYIMRANGAKEPWSDAQVVKEELEKLGYTG